MKLFSSGHCLCVASKCQSSGVLGLVDNYALVCLDICWCYLCLQNISALPDAGQSAVVVVVVVVVVGVVVVVVVVVVVPAVTKQYNLVPA